VNRREFDIKVLQICLSELWHFNCRDCVQFGFFFASSHHFYYSCISILIDRLCGLVVSVLGYRSGGPGSISGTTRKKNVVGLERGALSLVSTN
jgi:hypothetical protein